MKKFSISREMLACFLRGCCKGFTRQDDWAGAGRYLSRREFLAAKQLVFDLGWGEIDPTKPAVRAWRVNNPVAALELADHLSQGVSKAELHQKYPALAEVMLYHDGEMCESLPWFAVKEEETCCG